jgi:hypothetical protein
MRIKTDGTHEYRLDLLRRVMQRTGEGTKSGAFDFATEYTLQMLDAIDEASEHPDMTPELAEVLSTSHIEIEHRGYDVDVSPSRRARAEE